MSLNEDEPIYMVTVTSQTVGGSTETLCAQIHLLKEPLNLLVTLEVEGASKITVLQQLVSAEFHLCVQFQVPPVLIDTVATIHSAVTWGGRYLRKKTKILIKPSAHITLIQTDKPIYKPGQTVQFRVVSLDSSLASYSQVYRTVELQDPDMNRIAQWLNQSTTSGILDLSHPTTTEAKQGVYTITTWTEMGEQTFHIFEIIEYVLPKFELKVHLPDSIISDTEVTVKICGKYTYGKPVLGSVTAEMCTQPDFFGMWGPYPRGPVMCRRNVNMRIIVKGADSSPMPNKSIYLYEYNGPNTMNRTLTTDSNGVASFLLDTSSWEMGSVSLEARCFKGSPQGDSKGYVNYEAAYHSVYKFYSKSKSFLMIKQAQGKLPCDEEVNVLVDSTIYEEELNGQKTLDFFYLVLSKGKMVEHGYSPVTLTDGDDEGEVKIGKLSLTLERVEELVPYAQVVVYTVLPMGEIVADSSDFPIQLCFRNKVSLQFSSPQQLPGEKTSLELQAQPGSLCSLRAIDQSVLLKKPEEELNAKSVYDRLPVQRLQGYPSQPSKETIRTFFPETWIWELVPVGDSGSVRVEKTVPDTITKWVANAFCTSSAGFGLAANTGLTAFQPFFLSLTLPYSIIRGEVFTLKATVFNYLSKCIMVQVSLAESAQFTAQPCHGCQYRRCLCGEESDTFSWVLTPTALGEVSIKASAEALSTEDLCGNEVVTVPERGQIDTVVRKLLVEPEGIEQTFSYNALMCPKEGAVEEAVSLTLPEGTVEGSAKASVSVLGDLMGRAMRNLDGLLAMPYGCGEQNMLRFAPNIFILRYLESTGQLTPEIRAKAITFLESGYQRELNYKHRDGSYSAFGQRDPSGNTWLTAFVMKSFGGARPYIFIDPEHITSAKAWLSRHQNPDGCIRSVGKLFHNEMKGGVSDEVMLTAYVTAALLELDRNVTDPMVQKSLSCLKLASDQLNSIYATALLSYTFSLAGDHDMRTHLIGQLDRVAKTKGEGRHWEQAETCGIDSLSVEMTSYVLLALLSGPPLPGFNLSYSSAIVHWLAQQQNPYGGFSSTQDTVVALQALTLYGAATFSPGGASTVTVASTGSYKQQFSVDQHNRLLYQEEQLQEVPGVYSIKAEGESCVFVQIALSYNIPPPPDSSSFTITATAAGNCSSTRRPSLVVTVDVRYNGKREETNMVIISVRLLSGFLLEKSSLTPLKADPTVKWVEEKEGHVIIYLDELKRMEPKMYNLIIVEDVPVRNLKPAVVKVYDYYKKSDEAVSEYSSPCAQGDKAN
ncbi:alpha-2-macroglobulin-like [Megalops cyprinoides]|uniref:alpha-2-macroglobulin-like n=1 Tax=Megalops cyprinoides TaxID=118141 RepID=UPI0018655F48|nr:alpha-2-macroglobulin-like [Megalops cyprinoides]